ncbi:MAG TPA: hypothetical protein VKE70_17495 [Candidatus Solibacter sp.]|nr:hypothetical protein [Candidatus Solibacter sp.]
MAWYERAFFVIWGVLAIAGCFQKVVYFRFGKGKGPWTHTLTPVGRACFIILGVACIFAGITGITEFVRFR